VTALGPLAEAAGNPAVGRTLLGFIVLALAVGYLAASTFWPYANCGKCGGGGRFRSPSGKAWRSCRRCKGTGFRLRIGRRVWNHYRHATKDSNR